MSLLIPQSAVAEMIEALSQHVARLAKVHTTELGIADTVFQNQKKTADDSLESADKTIADLVQASEDKEAKILELEDQNHQLGTKMFQAQSTIQDQSRTIATLVGKVTELQRKLDSVGVEETKEDEVSLLDRFFNFLNDRGTEFPMERRSVYSTVRDLEAWKSALEASPDKVSMMKHFLYRALPAFVLVEPDCMVELFERSRKIVELASEPVLFLHLTIAFVKLARHVEDVEQAFVDHRASLWDWMVPFMSYGDLHPTMKTALTMMHANLGSIYDPKAVEVWAPEDIEKRLLKFKEGTKCYVLSTDDKLLQSRRGFEVHPPYPYWVLPLYD